MSFLRTAFAIVGVIICLGVGAQSEPEHAYETLATKFGPLEYMRPSHDIRLNGQVIVQSGQHTDPYGYRLYLVEAESYAAPSGRSTIQGPNGLVSKRNIDRVVVSETAESGCARQFLIIDLRGEVPHISEPFGLNPTGKSCHSFKSAIWGKDESTIFLAGNLRYTYHTGAKVVAPSE